CARLFYHPRCFTRVNAAPRWVRMTLFGDGGLQSLEGEEHRNRKERFLRLTSSQRSEQLLRVTAHVIEEQTSSWRSRSEIVLYREFQRIFTKAACRWAGVPLAREGGEGG